MHSLNILAGFQLNKFKTSHYLVFVSLQVHSFYCCSIMVNNSNKQSQTYRISVKGLVQGVGFRPFIYRTAVNMNLLGTVENRNDGVVILCNAAPQILHDFVEKIKNTAPPASSIRDISFEETEFVQFDEFRIVKSTSVSESVTDVSPDIAVCDDCLKDMKQQANRIDYPFINCTNCGPRFTIIEDLPYDREKTSMKVFRMCPDCHKEYTNIMDRRFHAQPLACAVCGPQYTLHCNNTEISDNSKIINILAEMLEKGKIVTVKGLGGFFIACDAMNEEAVSRLRMLKNREAKPFALMFRDIETVREYTFVNEEEEKLLLSLKRPIVLLTQKQTPAPSVNVGFDTIGAMLPYMPLHYLLFEKSQLRAIVLTSGNISDEPIVIDNTKALEIFGTMTDAVLTYNRDIHNRTDDSVVKVMNQKERVFRRSRGYAPVPVPAKLNVEGILATGAELVNCFCIGKGNQAILSQHIGDLKNLETFEFFAESVENHKKLFRFEPRLVVADMHPDYFSTRYALEQQLPVVRVQHHHAHIASCMAEHGLEEQVIGVAMDGTGYGDDGNIWGGEFLVCDYSQYRRMAHFDYLPLPGGDKVTHEPWRSAVSMLKKVYGNDVHELGLPFLKAIDSQHVQMILTAIDRRINAPLSSGAGRVFDAVSAMINLCPESRFHAEAPMRLEAAVKTDEKGLYEFHTGKIISYEPMIKQIVSDILRKTDVGVIAARFHNTIISIIVETVDNISRETGLHTVVLSGGSFQNKFLTENVESILQHKGYKVYSHEKVPANDGGIALGQLMVGAARCH
jgi:hydrogenase maturation protein HypF